MYLRFNLLSPKLRDLMNWATGIFVWPWPKTVWTLFYLFNRMNDQFGDVFHKRCSPVTFHVCWSCVCNGEKKKLLWIFIHIHRNVLSKKHLIKVLTWKDFLSLSLLSGRPFICKICIFCIFNAPLTILNYKLIKYP